MSHTNTDAVRQRPHLAEKAGVMSRTLVPAGKEP